MRRAGLTLMEMVVVLVILVALAGLLVPLMNGVNSDAQFTTTKASMTALRNAIVAYNQDMKLAAAWSVPTGATLTTAQSAAISTGIPLTLKDLVISPVYGTAQAVGYQPVKGAGWRGPYLLQATGAFPSGLNSSFYPAGNAYGAPANPTATPPTLADPCFLDAWGNPIVLQWPVPQGSDSANVYAPYVRLVSAGRTVSVTSSGHTTLQGVIVTPSDTTGNTAPYQYVPTQAQRGSTTTGAHNILMFIFVQDPYPWSPTN